MFQTARLKLTIWYLLIIMLISLAFSIFIYNALTFEFSRLLRVEQLRREGQFQIPPSGLNNPFRDDMQRRWVRINPPNPEVIQEAKDRLLTMLGLVNLGIFIISGLAGYFLAGRTLKPIKQMMDEQNRFITDASHELRTPLTSLKSEIEVNIRDKKLSLQDARRLIKSNLEEVNNLQYLSDNLIKLTQYPKANGIFFEKIYLKQVAEEAVRKVSNLAKYKKISIKNKIKEQTFEADKQKLTEILVILLDNAIKYSPKNTTVTLSSMATSRLALIEVEDQGMGIKEEDIPHLFDRFYRGDRSRVKTDIEGYGLGLSIAKQIIDKHHGSIKIDSTADKGTIFTVQIPLKQPKTPFNLKQFLRLQL